MLLFIIWVWYSFTALNKLSGTDARKPLRYWGTLSSQAHWIKLIWIMHSVKLRKPGVLCMKSPVAYLPTTHRFPITFWHWWHATAKIQTFDYNIIMHFVTGCCQHHIGRKNYFKFTFGFNFHNVRFDFSPAADY